jgi:hypothetical protein
MDTGSDFEPSSGTGLNSLCERLRSERLIVGSEHQLVQDLDLNQCINEEFGPARLDLPPRRSIVSNFLLYSKIKVFLLII